MVSVWFAELVFPWGFPVMCNCCLPRLVFDARAVALLAKRWHVREECLHQAFTQRFVSGRAGTRELIDMLWAGLEGGREPSRGPWTLGDVMAMVDDAGGAAMFFNPHGQAVAAIAEAWGAAFNRVH